jgi:hypothetical protein
MARPLKEGLDYFPLDVDIDQDDKVVMVEAQYPEHGFNVIIRLFMRIYSNGYYSKWTKREQIIFSKRINVNNNYVSDVVDACIEEGLFNKDMYEKYEILTSQGIQERYLEAVKRRKQTIFHQNYFLIDDVETIIGSNKIDVFLVDDDGNKINVNINPNSKGINDNKSTQRKGNRKEIKTEDNIVSEDKPKKLTFLEFVKLTQEEFEKLKETLGSEEVVNDFIFRLNSYIGSKGKKYKSHYHTILSWYRKDNKSTQSNKIPDESGFDLND